MKRLALALTLGWLVPAIPSMADEPGSPAITPEARTRLDDLIAAYRALPAYVDQGKVALVVKVGDRPLRQSRKASVAFARPNRLDVQTDFVRVISDGSKLTSIVYPLKTYQTVPLPPRFTESSLRGGPLGAIEFGNVEGLPLLHVLNLVLGDEPDRLIQDFTPTIRVEPDQEVGGIAYRVLRLDESDNHDWRFLIDPKSGLLAFIDLVVEGDATKSSIAGGETHVESLRWTAGTISTQVPPDETFTFEPPAGFARIEKLESPAEAKAGENKK